MTTEQATEIIEILNVIRIFVICIWGFMSVWMILWSMKV